MKNKLKTFRRGLFEFFGNPKYSRPALFDIDQKMEKFLNFKNGFFIEVGGNDGYRQSNTYYLEKFLGWQGILVEGIPDLYEKCRCLRKKSTVYNYALISNKSKDDFVEMHYANLMPVVEGSLKSEEAQKKHIEKGILKQKLRESYTVKVPTRTLSSILDEYPNLPQVDFMSLDVEGYELSVLEGLNIEKYRPTYILVESKFFDDINSFLTPFYELVEQVTHHDYLYYSNVNRINSYK